MGKLTCNCLNVKIHTKNDDFSPTTADKTGLDPDACKQFFASGISEVSLHLEGVRVEHQCLVKHRQFCGWQIHQCLNCHTHTHAVSPQSRVVVNASLKSDQTSIESLSSSEDFSPLYKVLLPSRNDNQPVRSLGVQSGKYESLQQVLTSIQQQLNQFLVTEEAAMENRIREYQEAQRQAYADLQSKVRRDKNTMINMILAAEQDEISESLSEAMGDSGDSGLQTSYDREQDIKSSTESEKPNSRGVTPRNRLTRNESISKRKSMPIEEEPQVTPSGRTAVSPAHRASPSPDDIDGVFDFDPAFQEDNNQPFYTSDDENDDTDDSSINDEVDGRTNHPHSLYSASVPISMPHWGGGAHLPPATNRRSYEDEEDDFAPAPNPEDMAASIKALAKSVHGDGTEIFGDLPTRRTRARLNTSEFGKP